ncbi:MAG: hypothetical protein JNN09_02415 [Alphaproteobacteria bacterium]|nr:hypothetical protein [Alphaproteobacteria bacterium]
MSLQEAFVENHQSPTIPDLFSYIMHGDPFSIGDKNYQRKSSVLCEERDDGSFHPSDLSAEAFLLAIHTKNLKPEREYHVNGELGKVLSGSCFVVSDEEDAPLFKVSRVLGSLKLQQVYFAENGTETVSGDPVGITANELLEAITGTNLKFCLPWTCPTRSLQPIS